MVALLSQQRSSPARMAPNSSPEISYEIAEFLEKVSANVSAFG